MVARLAHPISGLPEIGTTDAHIGNSRRAMSAKGDHKGRPYNSQCWRTFNPFGIADANDWEDVKDHPMSTQSAIVPPAAVAVIGLGNMGVPMGLRLIKAGFEVTGFDVSEAARKNFAAAGGRIVQETVGTALLADLDLAEMLGD